MSHAKNWGDSAWQALAVSILCTACIALVALGVSPASAGASDELPFDLKGTDATASIDAAIDQATEQAETAIAESINAEADKKEELATRKSRSERRRSATRFGDATPGEARSVLFANFIEAIVGVSATPIDSIGRGNVESYRDAHTAVVEGEPGEPDQVAVSTTPIRTVDDQGRMAPVDTTLEPSGGSWEPKNGEADVSIPGDSGGSASVGEFSFEADVAGGGEANSLPAGDSARFYPEVGTDTDLVLAATARGVETFFSLRSPDSPESQSLDLDLPDGAGLVKTSEGAYEVVDGTGDTIGRIHAPVAVDSQGTPVPVTVTTEGSNLTLTTEHVGEDLAYPILVDPLVEVDLVEDVETPIRRWSDLLDEEGNLTGPWDGGWYGYDSGGPNDLDNLSVTGGSGDGLYIDDQVEGTIHGGIWIWLPPQGVHDLTQVDFGPYNLALNGDTSSAGGTVLMAMGNAEGQQGEFVTTETTAGYTSLGDDLADDPIPFGIVMFGLLRIKLFGSIVGDNDHSAYLGGAVAYYTEEEPEDTTEDGAYLTGDLAGQENVYADPAWSNLDEVVPLLLEAADDDDGVKKIVVSVKDENDDVTVLGSYVDPCDGTPLDPCPATVSENVDLDFSLMDEGPYRLKVRAYDPLDQTAGGPTLPVTIDRTAPVVEIGSDFASLENTTTDRTDLSELNISAVDDAGDYNSGVWGIDLIDELDNYYMGWNCETSDCEDIDYDVNLGSIADGEKTFRVEAHDNAGNIGYRYMDVTLDRTP